MFLNNVKYILSAPSMEFWIPSDRKEICFVGRSNVGKSTLINKITNNKATAKVSGTPGYTKYLNFFDVNSSFYLVDTPGYGYAKASWTRDKSFAQMMSDYINKRENLICIVMVIDAKIGLTSDDLLLLEMAKRANRKVTIIASKADKINQSEKHKLITSCKEKLSEELFNSFITYSSLNNSSVEKVVEVILNLYNS